MLGENVKMLMNADDAGRHDTYIANYIRTKNPKVIGSTRLVLAKVLLLLLVFRFLFNSFQ